MKPVEQSQAPQEIEPSSKIEVDPAMFEGATDGEKVSVQVEGTLKIKEDGTACIYPETVDGEPVTQGAEVDPGQEMMGRMKEAGYGGGQELE